MATDTIVSRFMARAEERPDAPAYAVKRDGRWQSTSWSAYAAEVREAARALLALGVGRLHGRDDGDEPSCVCILGFNRPEWTIFDLAAMAVGAAPAGIYTTCSPPEVAYIVGHTRAKVVLVESAEQYRKIESEWSGLPALQTVVLMRGAEAVDDQRVLDWEAFLAKGEPIEPARVDEHIASLAPGALATLIYTSGTTGPPKGVMLSHDNLSWTASWSVESAGATADDVTLSYLPLSHIAEQMFTIHVPASCGLRVHFAESIDKVADNLKQVRPTVFFGVPRIWEKMYAGVRAKLDEATGLQAKLVDWARTTATQVAELRMRGRQPRGWLALRYALFSDRIYPKIHAALGLDRARICVSGAAPIAADVLRFFTSLDLVIHEVYGQSEGTGPSSFNLPGATKLGSVGTPLRGTELRIAADGEIQVKGRHVFLGYFRDEAATAEALVDGWLCSGDLGRLDDEGFLHITGRKKDLIITAGGKNIAPKNIEAALKDHALVGEAVVIGDRRKYLTALISLDPDPAASYAAAHQLEPSGLADDSALHDELQRHLDTVNRELARVEQIKKFTVVPEPFSIDSGELTPTLKVKRKVVGERRAELIEAMYSEAQGGD